MFAFLCFEKGIDIVGMERIFFHHPFSHSFCCDYGTEFSRDEPLSGKSLIVVRGSLLADCRTGA
jgi:hypothetical protein